jgi:glutamyl-tRNA reductase
VRSETQLGAGTVSISSVAVDLAKRIFGDLADHNVLLVGAGEMAEQAAKALGKNAKAIHVCNRSFERAANLAAQFNGVAAPLEQLEQELLVSDVVVDGEFVRITDEEMRAAVDQMTELALHVVTA